MYLWLGFGLYVLIAVVLAVYCDGYGHPGRHH